MFEKSYNLSMSGSLIKMLGDQPVMKLVRGLIDSNEPRHLRELASQYSLSPSGVSDILRRLSALGVLEETKVKNRRCFSLSLPGEEVEVLRQFFRIYEGRIVQERASRFSKGAYERLSAMDEDAPKFSWKGKAPEQKLLRS